MQRHFASVHLMPNIPIPPSNSKPNHPVLDEKAKKYAMKQPKVVFFKANFSQPPQAKTSKPEKNIFQKVKFFGIKKVPIRAAFNDLFASRKCPYALHSTISCSKKCKKLAKKFRSSCHLFQSQEHFFPFCSSITPLKQLKSPSCRKSCKISPPRA